MTKSAVALDDKYTQRGGRVFVSSNQALVRLPLDQARRDRAASLKTAGGLASLTLAWRNRQRVTAGPNSSYTAPK